MTVQPCDPQIEALGQRLHVAEVLVPDAEAGRRPAGVGPVGRAAAEAGVHAHRDLAPGGQAAQHLELVERAGVDQHAGLEELRQPRGRHLRGELDLARREAGPPRALDLVVAGGIDVQAELAEEREDAVVRVRLHGVAQRVAERRRECQRGARGRLQGGALVDVRRSAEALPHLGGARGRQSSLHSPATSTARPSAMLVATASVNSM